MSFFTTYQVFGVFSSFLLLSIRITNVSLPDSFGIFSRSMVSNSSESSSIFKSTSSNSSESDVSSTELSLASDIPASFSVAVLLLY